MGAIKRSEVEIAVEFETVKGTEAIGSARLEAQASAERAALRDVDPKRVRSTCMDERAREKLLGGSTEIGPRLSVPGGADIYGLAIAELTATVPASVKTGDEALALAKRRNNAASIRSGGHVDCKAAAGFTAWMATIANNPEAIRPYAMKQLGDQFDEQLFAKVSENARLALASGRYPADWNGEEALVRVLGDEAAEAIEVLVPGPHKGKKVVRQKVRGKTVDQNTVVRTSAVGEGSFVIDDPHAEDIEAVQTGGVDVADRKRLAAHSREMIIGALAGAVPNETLYQTIISAVPDAA